METAKTYLTLRGRMASFDPVAPTAPSTKAPADEKAATSVRSFSLSTTKGDIPAVLDTLSLVGTSC